MPRKRLSIAIAAALLGLAAIPQQAAAHDEPVVGSLVGAGIGAALGGPPGAAAGALIGAALGAKVAHDTDHGRRYDARHHSRAYIEPPYREKVVYAPVSCEPARTTTYYKPSVVHRDDRVRVAQTAPKPKMKKVCRYVPVRHTTTVYMPPARSPG